MASRQGRSSPTDPRLIATLTDDLRIVTRDMMRRGFTRSVGGTLTSIEAFYLSRDDRQRLAELRPLRRQLRLGATRWWSND